jgi:bacterioferritin-associated ferredoxin
VIVCHCAVVTDRDVVDAWNSGARSLGQACRATGAGTDCGTCVFSLKRLLCEHVDSEFQALEVVEGAAS